MSDKVKKKIAPTLVSELPAANKGLQYIQWRPNEAQ